MALKIVTLLTQGKPVGTKLDSGSSCSILFTDKALADYLRNKGAPIEQRGDTYSVEIKLAQDIIIRPSRIPNQYRIETFDKVLGRGTFGLVSMLGLTIKSPDSDKPTRATNKVLKEMIIAPAPKKGTVTEQIENIFLEFYFLQLQLEKHNQRAHLSFRINEYGEPVAQITSPQIAGQELFDIIDDTYDQERTQPDTKSPLSLSTRLGYLIDIGNALTELETLGIAHRDLKLANILADSRSETAAVIDLGLAGHIGAPGRPAGTPDTVAPEIIKGIHSDQIPAISADLDKFSYGIVMAETLGAYGASGERAYEFLQKPKYFINPVTLTGFLEFNGPDKYGQQHKVIRSSLPSKCFKDLETLVYQLGKNNPEKRPDIQTEAIPILARSQAMAYVIERRSDLNQKDRVDIYNQFTIIQQLTQEKRINKNTANNIAQAFITLKDKYDIDEMQVTNLLFLRMNIETLTDIKTNVAELKKVNKQAKTLANNVYGMVEEIKKIKVAQKIKAINKAPMPDNPTQVMFTQLKREQLIATQKTLTSNAVTELQNLEVSQGTAKDLSKITKFFDGTNVRAITDQQVNDLFTNVATELKAQSDHSVTDKHTIAYILTRESEAFDDIDALENEPDFSPSSVPTSSK